MVLTLILSVHVMKAIAGRRALGWDRITVGTVKQENGNVNETTGPHDMIIH